MATADGATTIGARHSTKTPHLKLVQAKRRAETTPVLPNAPDLRQIAESADTATTLRVRARHIQERRAGKSKWQGL